MAKKKQIIHDNRPNAKIQKLVRQEQRRSTKEKRQIAEMQAERMRQEAIKTDATHANMKSFRLSDADYAAVLANKEARKEQMNYGASGAKQKAMRRNNIIYVIQSTVTGEVQEILFRDRMAAHYYFIGNRFEVIQYDEFKARSNGYKDELLDPSKSAKAAREQAEADATIQPKDEHEAAMWRAESGTMSDDEAEELGIDLHSGY